MAGTSTRTQQVSVRLPNDVANWLNERPLSQAQMITRALRALKSGGGPVDPNPRIAELEAEVARLREDSENWRAIKRATLKRVGHHPAGPVYEPKLSVQGTTTRTNFRPGTNADKAAKSG